MDQLLDLTPCEGRTCGCLHPKSSVALISIVSMVVCATDLLTYDPGAPCCEMKEHVERLRHVLIWGFQIANMLLLLSILGYSLLVAVYVWYTLGFVVMGLCVTILELLFRIKHEGNYGLVCFVTEVAFLFVVSRCLPIVNKYKKHLDHHYD